MLQYLQRYCKDVQSDRHTLTGVNKFFGKIGERTTVIIDELQSTTLSMPTKAIDYINGLIIRADLEYILSKTTDIARFEAIRKEYEAMYTSYTKTYPVFSRMFVDTTDINELVIFTDSFDLIERLPFGSTSWTDWKNLSPITVICSDTIEFSSDMTGTYIGYDNNPPGELIVSIDIQLLLNMYVKYRTTHPEEFELQTDNRPFIYKYCMVPMIKSLVRAWSLNFIAETVDSQFLFNSEYTSTIPVSKRSYFASAYMNDFKDDVQSLVADMKNSKITPAVFLNTMKVDDTTTLAQLMHDLPYVHFIEDTSLNKRLGFMRDYQCLLILNRIYQNYNSSFDRSFRRLLKQLDRLKLGSFVRDPLYREHIELKLEYIRA